MPKGKNVLTTGDVARICNVAARTVSKWFDSGQLKGYRIPGSKDRRIPLNELLRFMKENNMPISALQSDKIRVLIVDSTEQPTIAELLRDKTNYEIQTAHNDFDTGTVIQKFLPHVLLISLLAEGISASEICRNIHNDEELQTIKVIAYANELSLSESSALVQKGFDECIQNFADIDEAVKKIEQETAIVY